MWWDQATRAAAGCAVLAMFGGAAAIHAADPDSPKTRQQEVRTPDRQDEKAAAREGREQARHSEKDRAFRPQVWRADRVIGMAVKNPQGESLGEIEEVVLTADRKRVAYAVLSHGGFLDIGDKLIALPWQALTPNADHRALVIHASKQELKNAPGFDSDQWPKMADAAWLKKVDEHYADNIRSARGNGAQAERRNQGGEMSQKHLWSYRVSKLMGLDIENAKNEGLGEIEGIYIDMHEGRPVYARIGFGGFLGIGEKNAYVPWSALNIDVVKEKGYLNATQKQMAQYANEDKASDFDLNDQDTAKRVHKRFDKEPYWAVFGYKLTVRKIDQDKAWQSDSDYNKRFDASATTTVEGEIQSVGSFAPETGATRGVQLEVKTSGGKTQTVHVAPEEFLDRQGVDFQRGDRVKVTGSRARFDDKAVLMATEIEYDSTTIKLRDRSGKPRWQQHSKDRPATE